MLFKANASFASVLKLFEENHIYNYKNRFHDKIKYSVGTAYAC